LNPAAKLMNPDALLARRRFLIEPGPRPRSSARLRLFMPWEPRFWCASTPDDETERERWNAWWT
jgi:hypothetical protein